MPRLPSSADVPTTSPGRDPGLNVPVIESTLGIAAKELAPAARQIAQDQLDKEKRIEDARIKQNKRNDTVSRANGINQLTDESDNERRRLSTESDLSNEQTLAEYGSFLSQRKQALIDEHRASGASEESITKLIVRLGDIESVAVGKAAGISVKLGNDKVDKVFNGRLTGLGESASQNPSIGNLNKLLSLDAPGIIEDLRDAYDPTQEDEKLRTAQEHIVLSATETLIKQGRIDQAERLLIDGGMDRFLPPEKQREIRRTIETIRSNRDKTANNLSERDKRRLRLIERGFDSALADDMASGAVKVFGPDNFGNYTRINTSTGERLPVDEETKNIIDGIISNEQQKTQQPEGRTIGQAVEAGTGPIANIQETVSNIFGPFMEGALFEETTSARQQIRTFSQVAKSGLVNNKRFPVAEQEIVARLLPDADKFFTDPDTARSNLKQLKSSLTEFKTAKEKELKKKTLSSKRKEDLSDQISRLDELLSMMEEKLSVSTQDEIDKLKSGTEFIWGPTGKTFRKD